MSVHTTSGLCRIALVTAGGPLPVALPTDVPVSDLLPALLRMAGDDLANAGIGHEGWVLQRVGEAPLAEQATLGELGLCDGDQLHFRPRRDELPAIDFDDLIAGVSSGIRERPDRWRDSMTRWMFLAGLAALAGTLMAALLLPAAGHERAITAGTLAVLAVTGASIAARGLGDRQAGLLLGCAGVAFGALAGLFALVPRAGHAPGAPQLLAALAAALAAAVLARGLAGAVGQVFLGVAVTAGLIGTGALVATAVPALSDAGAAAIVATLALALSVIVPMTAFRLAGLRLPALPADADELQEDIDPLPAAQVLDRTAAADRLMTALLAAVGVSCGAALTFTGRGHGWGPLAFSGAACALLLLRARTLVSAWQRLALLAPACYGIAWIGLHLAAQAATAVRLAGLVAGAAVAGGALLAAVALLPGRRLLPYWGRAAEIAEWLTALALLPLALQVLGVYHLAHGLFH